MALSALTAMAMRDGFEFARNAIFNGAAQATALMQFIHVRWFPQIVARTVAAAVNPGE